MLRRHFTSYLLSNSDSGLVPSFVDLGLSVMWASCNLGASSPEQMGNLFEWRGSSTSGSEDYELSLDKDPVYQAAPSDIRKFSPKTPTITQVKELLKCNKSEEVLNGVPGTRFTGDNGNSIFIPENNYWTPITSTASTYITTKATSWSPSKGIQDNATDKTIKLPFRGVCSDMPKDGAILLEYDKEVFVVDDRLYCFPKTWTSTKFIASTSLPLKVYASPSTQFSVESANGVTRKVYYSENESINRSICMSNKEMSTVTSLSEDGYIYIRFLCAEAMTLTPTIWNVSEDTLESELISLNTNRGVMARGSKTIYRIKYLDLIGNDITIRWNGNSTLPIYISYKGSYTLVSNSPYVLLYSTIKRKGTLNINADTIQSWNNSIGEDGYLYVRFNPVNHGTVIFAPTEPTTT